MAVTSSIELLRKRIRSDDDLSRTLIDNAAQGVERGTSLTRRMLTFARHQELEPEVVDVGELVDAMDDLLQRSIGPEIELETVIDEAVPPALVDPEQLELALLNLVVNARDAG